MSANHRAHHKRKPLAAIDAQHAHFLVSAIVPAQASELATGVPASITIAQAILESGWGKHHMGASQNYFGIKAQVNASGEVTFGEIASGYVDRSTREHIGSKDISVSAHFRSYKGMTESFTDHGMFLKLNPRYKTVIDNYAKSPDAEEFARGLQKAGYATDPHYAELLIAIMKGRKLYQYNRK